MSDREQAAEDSEDIILSEPDDEEYQEGTDEDYEIAADEDATADHRPAGRAEDESRAAASALTNSVFRNVLTGARGSPQRQDDDWGSDTGSVGVPEAPEAVDAPNGPPQRPVARPSPLAGTSSSGPERAAGDAKLSDAAAAAARNLTQAAVANVVAANANGAAASPPRASYSAAAARAPQQSPAAADATAGAPTSAEPSAQQRSSSGASTSLPALPQRQARGPALPPRGLGGMLPSRTSPTPPSPSTDSAAPPASDGKEAPAAAAPAAPPASTAAPAGPKLPPRAGGLGGLGMLPPRSAASSSGTGSDSKPAAAAPAAAAASKAAPAAVPAAASAPTASSGTPAASTGAAPSGGLSGLPARGPTLPGRSAGQQQQQASAPARPAVPILPQRAAPSLVRPAAQTAQPARAAAPLPLPQSVLPLVEVVDPEEPKREQKLRQQLHDLRVQLYRATHALGLRYDHEITTQFVGVMDRLEKAAKPMVKKRQDMIRLAEREARELDGAAEPDADIGARIKILLLGMTGTGKSELINSVLGRQAARASAFTDATRSVRVVKGRVNGIQLSFIDTPGLHASSSHHFANARLLKSIKAAYKRHKPHFIFYVDRLDAAKPGFGELSLLSQITEVMGAPIWREVMIVCTHAATARRELGLQYDTYSKQRRNILQNILRQAAGDMQLRNPFFMAESHPDCPVNGAGQPVVLVDGQNIAWRQHMLLNLVGYWAYEATQRLVRAKGKAGAKPAAGQQDIFKRLMRGRLPPLQFFVQQLAEGALKPDSWAVLDDPFGLETEDEEAEDFKHVYYSTMYKLARKGNPWAQKEYGVMLKNIEKLRQTFRGAYKEEDIDQFTAAGFEGMVTDGLDLGITFDPEDNTHHRYCYAMPETDWQVMPTLDYYGFEHEDAITGFVAEYNGQAGNRDGIGGFPMDLTVTVEKDKNSLCLQTEGHLSMIHTVRPFGKRHVTQVTGSLETLRPNVKDVLYQLEVNTFRDGLLGDHDPAGCGVMAIRMAENGRPDKGPKGLGFRVQDNLRVGPFKVDACAAKMMTEAMMGGKEEGWGGRAFVHYDWLPGLGLSLDWFQAKAREDAPKVNAGFGANLTYEWAIRDLAFDAELDYQGDPNGVVHADVNIACPYDYKLAWLLLVPLVNYARDLIRNWRQRAEGGDGGEGMLALEEGEEGAEGEEFDEDEYEDAYA